MSDSALISTALRVSPSVLSAVITDLAAQQSDGGRLVIDLAYQLDGYAAANDGADVQLITDTGRALAGGMASTMADWSVLEADFRSALATLEDLEGKSNALRAEVANLPIVDVDPTAVANLNARFDAIRESEDDVYRGLQGAIDGASTGEDVVIDAAGIEDVIGRSVDGVDDADTLFTLFEALALVADYGTDGSFDIGELNDADRRQFEALVGLGEASPGDALLFATAGNDDFVDGLVSALETRDGATLESVLTDIEATIRSGETPEAAGLPESVFPQPYLELQVLEAEVDGPLRTELDANSGWVWLPDPIDIFDDPSGRDAAEGLIDENLARQAELRELLGIGGDPGIGRNATLSTGGTAAALLTHAGVGTFWSDRFAQQIYSDGIWETGSNDGGFAALAPHIADDSDNAVAFYNQLGADGSASLVLAYRDGSPESFAAFGDGLGLAAESGQLDFTAVDYVSAGNRNGGQDGSPLQLLAMSDTIPDGFLIDATVTQMHFSESLEHQFLKIGLMGRGPYAEGPGDYGDSPTLVMLDRIGDREPQVLLDLMDSLGPKRADWLLRYEPRWGDPPAGWETDEGNRLTKMLVDIADPTRTGDPNLSDDAAAWILNGAGNPSDYEELGLPAPVGDAVENIILDRNTVIVQSPSGDADLLAAGIDRPRFDHRFDEATIDNAIEAVFRGGGGDELLAFQNGLVRDVVTVALAEGGGDPAAMVDLAWLGEMDGRINGGMERADIAEAHDLDARNGAIQSVIGTATEAAIGARVPGADDLVGGSVADQLVGHGLGFADSEGRFLPTDNELRAWEDRWGAENAEPLVLNGSLLSALEANDRIVFPNGLTTATDVVDADIPLRSIPILDDDGKPLVIDGEPVTVADWTSNFFVLLNEQGKVERSGE